VCKNEHSCQLRISNSVILMKVHRCKIWFSFD